MTGSLLVLSGTAYLFSITNDLNINNLLYLKFSNYENNILMLLFFFGFGVKIPI
jgi:NADH:ubiquinone oxidoreductase subunit 4 (subunit M)